MIPELPSSQAGRRALIGLGVLALFKLVGWILIAVSLARGIAQLAAALPASDAAQLLQLLFDSPRTAPGLIDTLVEFTMSTDFMVTLGLGFGGAVLRGLAEWGQQVLATRAALEKSICDTNWCVTGLQRAHTDRAGRHHLGFTRRNGRRLLRTLAALVSRWLSHWAGDLDFDS